MVAGLDIIIEIIDGRVVTQGEFRTILQIPDMKVSPRDFVVLIGKNGVGKSALMKAICGCGPFSISGKKYIRDINRFVYLDGEPLAGIEHWVTAREIIQLFCRASKRELDRILNQIDFRAVPKELVDAVKGRRQIADISSGQRQILFMHAAVPSGARLWVIDEGLSSLDPFQLKEAVRILKTSVVPLLNERKGAIMATTHNLSVFNGLGALFGAANWRPRVFICNDQCCKEMHHPIAFPLNKEQFESLYQIKVV